MRVVLASAMIVVLIVTVGLFRILMSVHSLSSSPYPCLGYVAQGGTSDLSCWSRNRSPFEYSKTSASR
jgi:hypothetical protein